MRILRPALALVLALAPALPAAAQVRAAPASLIPALPATVVPSLGASAFAPAGASGAFFSPALAPSLSAPAALAPSLLPAAAPAAAPALSAPAVAHAAHAVPGEPGAPAAKGPVLHGFHELRRYASASASGGALFDGAAEKAAAVEPVVPSGVVLNSVVRLESPREASKFIPSTPNTGELIEGLARRWSEIGWLDLRLYRDAKGEYFRTLDLSGRPELAEKISELQPHEVSHIRKIGLTARDLQLVIREEGKTPDLIVDGVVTELKSLHPAGQLEVQLAHAHEQVAAHAARHGLGRGAVSIDLMHRDAVPVPEAHRAIRAFAAATPDLKVERIELFAGADRKVFKLGRDGSFKLQPGGTKVSRFAPPRTLAASAMPDADTVLQEITEPARRLAERGILATVTVYGSARIPSPEKARENLRRVMAETGRRPRAPENRRKLAEARRDLRLSRYYAMAEELGAIVAKEGGGEVAVVTGGGPSLMEAANKGAYEAGGPSVGYNIILEKEQGLNAYTTPGLSYEFQNFATRKMALRHGAMGLVYFPGGFGTMDELFEVLTLMQTKKMPRTPIVLMGERAYWEKVLDFKAFAEMGLISPGDLSLFVFAENARQAWDAIAKP